MIHILSTMTHPCLHYQINEAWFHASSDEPEMDSTATAALTAEAATVGGDPMAAHSKTATGGQARWSYVIDPVRFSLQIILLRVVSKPRMFDRKPTESLAIPKPARICPVPGLIVTLFVVRLLDESSCCIFMNSCCIFSRHTFCRQASRRIFCVRRICAGEGLPAGRNLHDHSE